MIEHVGQYVEWWGRMKAGLDALKGELAKVVQDGPRSLHMLTGDVTDGWNDIADQFALYVYKVIPGTSQTFLRDSHLSHAYHRRIQPWQAITHT
jgi:hypothetical protein